MDRRPPGGRRGPGQEASQRVADPGEHHALKKPQKAICDGATLPQAKVVNMRAVALPRDGQRRVACLSRRKGAFARQLLPWCPDSKWPFKPLEFHVAAQRAFGVPLTSIKALAGQTMRYGDKNENSFVK